MRTSGYGNDSLIMVVPVCVFVAVGIWLYGGPAETFGAINSMVGDAARATLRVVSELFS
jgi:hypothetical protein